MGRAGLSPSPFHQDPIFTPLLCHELTTAGAGVPTSERHPLNHPSETAQNSLIPLPFGGTKPVINTGSWGARESVGRQIYTEEYPVFCAFSHSHSPHNLPIKKQLITSFYILKHIKQHDSVTPRLLVTAARITGSGLKPAANFSSSRHPTP